jgi:hypothetical protein
MAKKKKKKKEKNYSTRLGHSRCDRGAGPDGEPPSAKQKKGRCSHRPFFVAVVGSLVVTALGASIHALP